MEKIPRSRKKTGAAGTSLALTLSTTLTWQELQKKAQTNGLRLQLLREAPGKITLILSCSSMPVADFVPACKLLKKYYLTQLFQLRFSKPSLIVASSIEEIQSRSNGFCFLTFDF